MRKKKKEPGKARNLVECSPHRTTGGGFFEGLTVLDAEYESRNEANALNTLVLCSDVRRISTQPLTESYYLDGKERRYTPDIIVDTFESELRLEIKSIAYLVITEADWKKYLAIAEAYRKRGVPFAFLVDAQLEEQPRFGNVKLISRYVTCKADPETRNRVLETLARGPLSVKELKASAGVELLDILTLIANRWISIDWQIEFNRDSSLVSLPGVPYEGLKLADILRSTRYGDFLAALAMGRRSPDKFVLEDSKTWRRNDYRFDVWAAVGGFVKQSPIRHLEEQESLPRDIKRRRNFAPGQLNRPSGEGDEGGQA